jgi:class 3 adenylate cyclase
LERPPQATIATTDRLLEVFSKRKDLCALAEVNGFRSTSFTDLGALDSAMACAHRVLEQFSAGCDSLVYMRGQVALSYLWLKLKDYDRVDSICTAGIAMWDPSWRPTVLRNALLTNRAIAAARRGDLAKAESGFRNILVLATAEGAQQDMFDAMQNLGAMKSIQHQLDSAEYYYRASLANALANGKVSRTAHVYTNLAFVAGAKGEMRKANELLKLAMAYADSANDLSLQVVVHGKLARNYHALGDDANAYRESMQRYDLNDSLLSAQKLKTLADMQAQYESVRQEKEIGALRAENLATELEKAKARRTRIIFQFVALGVIGLAVALFSRLRYVGRSRLAIKQAKAVSDGLLHNILPEEVADEIRAKGYADAREFERATILFTDFKDFTAQSGSLTAQELVAEIDHCFKAFDGIVEKYGIEKIKTIGDAYMAAGGLPEANPGSPLQTVLAALEMVDFMKAYQAERMAQGRQYFIMRTGLHTGPVIAGIVGLKKYAYDIWGDTVNVANRMETYGEVGKVNISQATYGLVKDQPGLRFTPRGAVEVKGKGRMEMYFVERA